MLAKPRFTSTHLARGIISCANTLLVQGYLAHKKQRPPRTLQKDHAYGPRSGLGGWTVSYERDYPAEATRNPAGSLLEGVSSHRVKPPFGVVTGCQSLDVSSYLHRRREVVVLAN